MKFFACLLICSSFAPTIAAANDGNDTHPNTDDHPNTNLAQSLNWTPRSLLTKEQQAGLPDFCHGRYIVPNIISRTDDAIEATADEGFVSPIGTTRLQGNVEMQQGDKLLYSDRVDWSIDQQRAELSGSVRVQTPSIVLVGDSAVLDNNNKTLRLDQVGYSIPEQHIRGSAKLLSGTADNQLTLSDANLTFCEPGNNDWDIAASTLTINQQSGFGSAWNTRLRIAGVPVLYIPYYRFPIDDRRMTGFLDPSFSFNSKAQLSTLALPFYINIAPNLDATLTPQRIIDRGILIDGQLRHKTLLFGDGELNYGVLNRDDQTNTKRFRLNYLQTGKWSPRWSHRLEYNQISDNQYFNDMSPSGRINRSSHLPRRAAIEYRNTRWQATLISEEFQTINSDIGLASRPYRRAPQLNVQYQYSQLQGLSVSQRLSASQFSRNNQDIINGSEQTLTGKEAINSRRYVSDTTFAYRWQYPFGFIEPQIEYRHRYYDFTDLDNTLNDFERQQDFGTARYQLDGQLIFERPLSFRQQNYLQTFEPRILYVYSRFAAQQNELPTYDTRNTTFNFSNLFSGDRFSGDDRLADLNQLSIGATTRFFTDTGEERLKLSVGRIYYQSDRNVQLTTETPADTTASSPLLAEIRWLPSNNLRLDTTIEWNTKADFIAQRRLGLRYQNSQNRFFSLSSTQVQAFNATTQEVDVKTDQIDAGIFWSLTDRWAVFGRQLYDLKDYQDNEAQPVDDTLESLAGFEYQNCCWRIQASYRESTLRSDSTTTFNTEKRYGFLLSFELKGLGSFGDDTDGLISDAVGDYSRRRFHTY